MQTTLLNHKFYRLRIKAAGAAAQCSVNGFRLRLGIADGDWCLKIPINHLIQPGNNTLNITIFQPRSDDGQSPWSHHSGLRADILAAANPGGNLPETDYLHLGGLQFAYKDAFIHNGKLIASGCHAMPVRPETAPVTEDACDPTATITDTEGQWKWEGDLLGITPPRAWTTHSGSVFQVEQNFTLPEWVPELSWAQSEKLSETPGLMYALKTIYMGIWQSLNTGNIEELRRIMKQRTAACMQAYGFQTEEQVEREMCLIPAVKAGAYKFKPLDWPACQLFIHPCGNVAELRDKATGHGAIRFDAGEGIEGSIDVPLALVNRAWVWVC